MIEIAMIRHGHVCPFSIDELMPIQVPPSQDGNQEKVSGATYTYPYPYIYLYL